MQDASKKDDAVAEQLVNDQLMFHVLQTAMSEVVRSQADGVLTDEVVEQLLDTTCADPNGIGLALFSSCASRNFCCGVVADWLWHV